MKKMLFIMNPYSGLRRAAKFLPDMIMLFNQYGFDVITHMTTHSGDATETARRLAPQVEMVVCCGGDGTLNETVSAILDAELDIPIGYIPAGSTNDFAASLKLSLNPVQAAKDIVEGRPVAYDVGKFNDRHFSYVASFGAFTRVSYNTPQYIKNALGHTAYLLSGISELSQLRKLHVRMDLEDEIIEDDFLFGAISNSTSVGGILSLAPDQVDMCDGLFEVLLVRSPKNLAELSECIVAVQNQKYNDCAMITFCSARKIKVYADPNMAWTLDGEKFDGEVKIEVENLHRAVRLVHRVADHA